MVKVSSAPPDNSTDLSALLAFKAHVSDPNGILSANWTTNTSFCAWVGVTCSRRRQRVTGLNLYGLSLGGTVADQLGNLSFMSYLNLGNNTFSGPIPGSLTHLRRLRFLNFGSNMLSGPIPTVIFNMSSLVTLSLAFNTLSGPLPNEKPSNVTMLPQLQRFSVSGNQITGEVPSSFAKCHGLQILSLSGNRFTGIISAEFGNLVELNQLYLGGNRLTGPIPTSIGNLTRLYKLDLSQNRLQGEIPAEIGNLVNLQLLNLAVNNLTGAIPPSLSNASVLRFLDLSHSKLTGPVPIMLSNNMPFLTFFNLEGNQLSGGLDFITSLCNCRALAKLIFSKNQFNGVVPDSIGNLSTSLLLLFAQNNHFSGEIPAAVGNLTNLLSLDFSSNELTGTLPLELTKLQKLQVLYLNSNRLQGSIPQDLGYMRSLGELDVHSNLLSGSIPESIGNITQLQSFFVGGNALLSGIPNSIWSLGNLLYLDLSNNLLGGSLPSEVGNLKVLNLMDLSANKLSGGIPSAFQDLPMLQSLNLSHNSFRGLIPGSFGKMTNIQILDLSYNALSGDIPKSLTSLRHLSGLNLSFNRLEGPVPQDGVFANVTAQSLMGNVALCGAPQLGFPSCSTHVNDSNSKKRLHMLRYIIPIIAFTLFFVVCLSVVLVTRQRRRKTNVSVSNDLPHLKDHRVITYHELARATDNFNEDNLVGRGSFGLVFKGRLDDGLLIAVKVLNLETEGSAQSFDAECHALSILRHRNLVKIITTCSNLEFKAIVLQFMPNGSLERWLHSDNCCLSLLQRLNIVLNVAVALEYLHHHNPDVVIHCDMKPSNVLLGEDMTAHVADFGIARLLFGDSSKSIVSATTPGTIGYIPPEYGATGKVSRMGDVYSYGILLLETFTGKRPTDAMFGGDLSLRHWVSNAHSTTLLDIVDCKLLRDDASGSYGGEPRDGRPNEEDPIARHQCLSSVLELGLLCSRESPKERIMMKDAVPRLQKIKYEYTSAPPISGRTRAAY